MKIVINGGGVIGLAASILLQRNNHDVTLVERSSKLGGLLNSIKLIDDFSFDFGTHIPRETGISELDDVLFGNLDKDKWNSFNFANVGNYFNGELNKDSQFIDASKLSTKEYVNGLADLFLEVDHTEEIENCNDYLKSQYGQTFSELIFSPIMKKLYGVDNLNFLKQTAPLLFGYSRLIVGGTDFTNRLKTMQELDSRIAFNQNSKGVSGLKSYYPKKNGINQWVDYLHKEALDAGVDIRVETTITNLDLVKKELTMNELKENYDLLVWTVPEHDLHKLMGVKKERIEQSFIGVNLYHFKYSGKLLTDNQYVYCNDANLKTFRVTLYDNSTMHNNNICTVEVLGEKREGIEAEILNELIKMELLSEGSSYIESKYLYLEKGFPVPTISAVTTNELNNEDILLLKKDANNFFMEDLLKKMYRELEVKGLMERVMTVGN